MAKAQELMEQNPELSKAVTELEEQTLEEQVLAKLKEIEAILTKLDVESIDLSVFLDQIQSFSDEKKAELQALVNKLDNPLGEKTITRRTCFGYGIDLLVWQEVWMKDGVITKYGSFYTRGLLPTSLLGIGGGNQINARLPLTEEVEFDALFYCEGVFHARPKAGQNNLAGISGSLDNYVFSFGWGAEGCLGNGSTHLEHPSFAVKTEMESRVKKILFPSEIGQHRSCVALLENKTMWVTGKNIGGELGLGNKTQVNTWTKSTDNVDEVFCGNLCTYVLKGTTLYACGFNSNGQLGNGTSETSILTQIKTSVSVDKLKVVRWYDGASAYGTAFFHNALNNRVYGAGINAANQIIAADTTDKSVFTEITNNMGESIECGNGTDFAIGLSTNILLAPNGGNTDLWVAGQGESGYGDSALTNTNNKRRKVTTLDGIGWKCECPILGYGEGTMKSSFFIYNEEKKQIKAFGYNAGGSALGLCDDALDIRDIRELSLPKSVTQFEVSFGWAKASGFYICVIADGTLYITGTSKSGMIAGTYTQLNPVVSVM